MLHCQSTDVLVDAASLDCFGVSCLVLSGTDGQVYCQWIGCDALCMQQCLSHREQGLGELAVVRAHADQTDWKLPYVTLHQIMASAAYHHNHVSNMHNIAYWQFWRKI